MENIFYAFEILLGEYQKITEILIFSKNINPKKDWHGKDTI